MIKCKEYLAFVDAKSGKIKERFEITLDQTNEINGRRPQLIKKIVGYALEQKYLKPHQLFGFLKRKKYITVIDLIRYAYGEDD